jgi:hypothetical protein
MNTGEYIMKKLLVLTFLSFFISSNGFAASDTAQQKDSMLKAIQKGAMVDEWTQYTPQNNYTSQTLYFKKSIKNKDYYTYQYQNRHKHKKTTVYVKVDYTQDMIDVKFVDEVSMNLGRVGNDSKMHNVLDELKDAINAQLKAQA